MLLPSHLLTTHQPPRPPLLQGTCSMLLPSPKPTPKRWPPSLPRDSRWKTEHWDLGSCWGQRSKFFLRMELSLDLLYPSSFLSSPSSRQAATQRKAHSHQTPVGPQKTLTHCGRCPQVPGCPRTPSCHCGSCPGSSSVPGTGTLGPEGVTQGCPEAAGCPGSCPPGRGSCGCAGHRLEGEFHGQG